MARIYVFLRNWLLPVAMIGGTLFYLIFARIDAFAPARPFILTVVNDTLPFLIFSMLFFTFCRIEIRDMKPRRWHAILLTTQTVLSVACTWLIASAMKRGEFSDLLAEGVLACLLSPTAAASAVITGKLGGSVASLTSYTLESNILSAILITTLCPLIHPIPGLNLFAAFLTVLYKISLLLLLPFAAAMAVRYFLPWLHERIVKLKDASYYLWGCTLLIVTGLTMRVVFDNAHHAALEIALVIAAAVVCVGKFAFGKFIGHLYSPADKISAGQAFGQKNTSFTIWMALTFLNPISAVSPGSYVIWQNIVNSWQLWRKRKQDARQ